MLNSPLQGDGERERETDRERERYLSGWNPFAQLHSGECRAVGSLTAKVRSFKEVLGAAEMSIEEGMNLDFESTFHQLPAFSESLLDTRPYDILQSTILTVAGLTV